jgi:hypothetical protein
VIIVDGLDEVEAEQYHDPTRQESCRAHEDDQHEILNALLALSQCPTFPFRVFIASRPERRISDFFATSARASTIDLFLDFKYSPDADIARYLGSKFAEIRRRTGITDVSWPGQIALDQIVDISSGQFVVPTTIIRWVEAGVPQQQLNDVLQQEWMRVGSRNPFAALDALYRLWVFRSVLEADARERGGRAQVPYGTHQFPHFRTASRLGPLPHHHLSQIANRLFMCRNAIRGLLCRQTNLQYLPHR